MSRLTMGSLFDGIGGFPLAAIRSGITPVWASEIEAFPIEVTKLRFPDTGSRGRRAGCECTGDFRHGGRRSVRKRSNAHAEDIRDVAGMLENAVPHITEWDETAIRQLVAQVKVLSKSEISVTLKSGIEIRQSISN